MAEFDPAASQNR